MGDLVYREGVYYQKFTDVPFTGDIDEGFERGSFKNGKKHGLWTKFWASGQLMGRGHFQYGNMEGVWFEYGRSGNLRNKREYINGEQEGF